MDNVLNQKSFQNLIDDIHKEVILINDRVSRFNASMDMPKASHAVLDCLLETTTDYAELMELILSMAKLADLSESKDHSARDDVVQDPIEALHKNIKHQNATSGDTSSQELVKQLAMIEENSRELKKIDRKLDGMKFKLDAHAMRMEMDSMMKEISSLTKKTGVASGEDESSTLESLRDLDISDD